MKIKTILDAIDLIKDFVGDRINNSWSVPVVDNNNNIVGIVTESDLFNALLLWLIAKKILEKEELSD